MENNSNEQILNRLNKIEEYADKGIQSYPNKIKPEYRVEDVLAKCEELDKEQLEKENIIVNVAGRVMTKRGQGKAGFLTIKDKMSEIQFYGAEANLSEEDFYVWNKIDLGDIVMGTGEVFRTKVGALAIRLREFKLVTKSIRPMPEKYHGLTDVEARYRQRYIDLMVNDEAKEVFLKRSKIITGMREYLDNQGYIEVDTPILQTMAGGAAAKPFITHHNTLDIDMYMRIAPELFLKRLIVGGMDRVYEIGRQFRNEGMSVKHNPEFTTMELYEAYADMDRMMEITEDVIQKLCMDVNGTLQINYEGTDIDLANFKKVHMVDLIKEVTGVDFWNITDIEEAKKVAKENNIELDDHHHTVGHIINEFFEQKCEETLIQPTMVFGHPEEVSPLSRLNDDNPRFTDRFELFIDTREYANAFSEINDPIDQKRRFEAQLKEQDLGNDEATGMDHDFIEALANGMPPTGGLGIGIDRLVMLLTDARSIRDVILFPTMKEINVEIKEEVEETEK